MAIRGYYLGCPGWGLKSWVGRLFPPLPNHLRVTIGTKPQMERFLAVFKELTA